MVNLCDEFVNFLVQNGYNVTYIRRDERVRCRCADGGEPSLTCPECLGTGFKVQRERHLTRRVSASVPESLVGILRSEEVGWVHPNAWIYYFKNDVVPKVKDLIIDDKVYIITHVEAKRQEKGQVSYYKVVARTNGGTV